MKRLKYKTEPKQPLDFKWVVREVLSDGTKYRKEFKTKSDSVRYIRAESKEFPGVIFELFSVSTDFVEAWSA